MIAKLIGSIIIFSPLARASWDLWAFTLIHLVSLVILIIWLIRLNFIKYEFSKTSLDFPILFILAFAFLSFFLSVNKYNSRNEFLNLVNYVFLFYVIVNYIKTTKERKIFLYLLFAIGFIVSVIGIYQSFNGISKVYSTLINPNILAGYLVMLIPLAVSYIIERFIDTNRCKNRLYNSWVIVSIFLMFITLVLTGSLGGLVSLYIGLLIMFSVYLRYNKQNTKIKLPLIMVSLISGFFIFFLIFYKFGESEVSNRIFWWLGALRMIQDRPLTGVGTGCFGDVYLKYKTGELNSLYAHNYFLQMGAEVGLLGLGAFVWMLVIFFRQVIKKLKSPLYIGFLSSISAILIFSLIDYNLCIPVNSILFWAILGMYFGIDAKEVKVNNYILKWLLNIVLVLAIIFGSIVVIKPFLASQRLVWGSNALNEGEINKAEELLKSSITLDRLNPAVYERLSELYDRRGNIDKSIETLKQAADLVPDNAFLYYKLGVLYEKKREDTVAISKFQKAISLHYQKIIYHVALGRIYEKQGLKELANDEYRIIRKLEETNK